MDHADAVIWTEGKTDWQHLKHAAGVLGFRRSLRFEEQLGDFGDDQLLKQCQALARVSQPIPTVFVFDRDRPEIVSRVDDPARGYRAWGNNVFSLAIPVPAHRASSSGVCVELLYTDDELATPDAAGRRLFLTTEFNPTSGRHMSDPRLSVGHKGKLTPTAGGRSARILDTDVFNERSENVALSKAMFANYVTERVEPFGHFQCDAFRPVFALIEAIIEEATPRVDLIFGDVDVFAERIADLSVPLQLAAIADAIVRTCKLAGLVFAAATLRQYERRIIEEAAGDAKKVRPIKHLLASSFGYPTLSVVHRLSRYTYHLIDNHAPDVLFGLRAMLAASPQLGSIGHVLDDLEGLFPPPKEQVRIVNKHQLRKPILDYVMPEFAKYEDRLGEIGSSTETASRDSAGVARWTAGLRAVTDAFAPLRDIPLRVRTIERLRSDSNEFIVNVKTYENGRTSHEQVSQTFTDLQDDRLETYELLLPSTTGGRTAVDLFPFVTIKNDRLHFYNRTRSQGYEYAHIFGTTGHLFPTKRKFSHVALRTTVTPDLQGLFWAPVLPAVSDHGVRANIPVHGPIIGRRQQLSVINDEIIEIPNQNGLVYGPGGVGKTALLLELSQQLFQSSGEPLFKNIIWVSAKRDFYDPTLDVVEAGQPQFRTLDNVLTAILEFHEFEDPTAYSLDDKKWLALELIREESTLLILDNFESVARAGQNDIIRFFGVDIKRALKGAPTQFKVVVTSRELIPSGFHQVRLKGLDKRDSKSLMDRLYEPYSRSGQAPLTDEQRDQIYEVTQGIPLIVKHCYAQVYEYNRPLTMVLKALEAAGNKVVEFSFAEMFALLKEDLLHLKLILLLEVSGRPLMLRQMADILGVKEEHLSDRLASLVNLQCVQRTTVGTDDKFSLNDEVKFLVRRLTQDHADLATEIKLQIASLSVEKRMDYTRKEFESALLFQDYVAEGHYVLGEDFIRDRLKEYPQSVLLNLYYAKYLKEIKRQTDGAIERLESIRERSGNDQQILRLLMQYYTQLDVPNFEQAHAFAMELEDIAALNAEIRLELAHFYVAWSTALKLSVQLDPLKEMLRQQKYKELADSAIRHLVKLPNRSHSQLHLLAQSYYNKWEYETALAHIDDALSLLSKGSHLEAPYRKLRNEILKRRDYDWRRKTRGTER